MRGSMDSVPVMLAEYAKRRRRIVDGLRAIPGVTCEEPAARFTHSPMLRRISRTALPAARSPKTPPNWPSCCSIKRASRLCPATPLALPDT